MMTNKPLPSHSDLKPYNHAVAGHEGTLCDPDGELFIKPCTQQEIDFYESAFKDHLEFAELMPAFMGTLTLNGVTDMHSIDEQLPAVAEHMSLEMKEEALRMAKEAAAETAASTPEPGDNVKWRPNKTRKIATNKSVVLENAAYGFTRPNILDAKLGKRLWADDAPLEKRQRFDEISKATTNGSHGFRIAGMRVYKGSEDPAELDQEGYKVYDKDYGRLHVNRHNVVDEMKKFIFNPRAGIDEDLGKIIAGAFVEDLKRVERILRSEESRMYSASLLFTFEGDGDALRAAIEQTLPNSGISDMEQRRPTSATKGKDGDIPALTTSRVDSAIVLDDDGEMVIRPNENGEPITIQIQDAAKMLATDRESGFGSEVDLDEIDMADDDEMSNMPKIYSLKLIDFAHASWVPGEGPDENNLFGPTVSDTRVITLQPFSEWRFEVLRSSPAVTVRVLSGTADRDGTELASNRSYTFARTRSKIYTLQGCTLEVTGNCDNYTASYPSPEQSPLLTYVNFHFALHEARTATLSAGRNAQGPRVMICGPANSGKTTLARTLVGLATRMGSQPMVANLDPGEGLLSLPGTLSAAVYGTIMDVEDPAGGFGVRNTPSSGPSAVPVKLPIVYYFGREKVEDDVPHWRDLTSKLASSVRAKVKKDKDVRAAGVVIDAPAVDLEKGGLDLLAHAVGEFAVNIIVVLGSAGMQSALQTRFAAERTPQGEPIVVMSLEKSDGVARRDDEFMRLSREATIKEYFFGDAKRTLSPLTQSVSFDDVAIFKAPDESEAYEGQPALEAAEISAEMSHWALAVMNASVNDPPETIRQAPVIGFIAIADVDEDRRRLKVLSPVSGRLGNQPLIWGQWPEPYINLLG
ncbi:hypothetical protein QBC47DRAFT_425122 [Echria macrotheca]|uniref:Polynucleotide 5'-hydroxyl-kinase GRC3 n=1 Tax=Echria macrotheca TaxID=438768 RepID=A0AAJ0B5V5_9PEZI|nr:hypothetical protein QBC47DRAFT_425122 [Echria macrotheca]